MAWRVDYHADVDDDLLKLGRVEARNILKVIDKRIMHGDPEQSGKPLSGQLAGCRRLRTGQTRIVYRVYKKQIQVLIIAVGMRRDDEIYQAALARVT